MTIWREARAKLHAENPALANAYDRLGPLFDVLSRLIDMQAARPADVDPPEWR